MGIGTRSALLLMLLTAATEAMAGKDLVRVNERVWMELREPERAALKENYYVSVMPATEYGIILNVQVVDESIPGRSGGSQLGSAVGSAAYIDHAFGGRNWNYSASGHLGASLLGSIIGGSMDAPPVPIFRSRYTITDLRGNVRTFDRVDSRPFTMPVGTCVSVPGLIISERSICQMDVSAIRSEFIQPIAARGTGFMGRSPEPIRSAPPAPGTVLPPEKSAQAPVVAPDPAIKKAEAVRTASPFGPGSVRCKFGTSGVVLITEEACRGAEGAVLK